MSIRTATRTKTWQKATALVPVALLSGAWTASMTGGHATAVGDHVNRLPDGSPLPANAIDAPASVSAPGQIAPGVPAGTADEVLSSAATNAIPAAALAAYQRAAQVIDAADAGCRLDWTIIAAIGRVESDHGRSGGNVLDGQGVSQPGIYGIPLDGSHGTQQIGDTDAGQYDDDPIWDRAVGPMQFIPSTWSVVGVDGDGDGTRNPQDVDDAALATGVYLCAGDEDLSTDAGQDAAIYRYNHSQAYVDLVKSIAAAYAAGDYLAAPTGSYSPTYFGSASIPGFGSGHKPHKAKHHHVKSGGGSGGTTSPGTSEPTAPSTPSLPGTGGNGNGAGPGGDPGDAVGHVGSGAGQAVATTQQLVTLCTDELTRQFGKAPDQAVDKCVAQLQGKTLPEAQAAVGNVVQGLADLVASLLGGLLGGGLLP